MRTFLNMNVLFLSEQNRTIRHISLIREGTEYYNYVHVFLNYVTFFQVYRYQ